jgi:hypothetical protein
LSIYSSLTKCFNTYSTEIAALESCLYSSIPIFFTIPGIKMIHQNSMPYMGCFYRGLVSSGLDSLAPPHVFNDEEEKIRGRAVAFSSFMLRK